VRENRIAKFNIKKQNNISLIELIDINECQRIQDNFAAVTEIGLRMIDVKGDPITLVSRKPRLFQECLPTFLGGEAVVDKNLSFGCLEEISSLRNFLVPLRVDKTRLLGYMIIGPVILVMRKTKEEYRQAAEKLNLGLDDLWDALLEIRLVSFQNINSILDLIREVCEYTLSSAYQNVVLRKEMMMTQSLAKISRLLDALLEVAFEISKAEVGSIMFLDKDKQGLSILASRGIPEKIVKTSRVRLGDGISGLAAKEGESFIIDENTTDNRITPYLKRPHLSSSMVLPIKAKDRVWGVMNLGVLESSPVKFNQDNLTSMQKLAELVTAALYQ
jgi:putative methionine-R-sulfoxide reductase with GAF domain